MILCACLKYKNSPVLVNKEAFFSLYNRELKNNNHLIDILHVLITPCIKLSNSIFVPYSTCTLCTPQTDHVRQESKYHLYHSIIKYNVVYVYLGLKVIPLLTNIKKHQKNILKERK